MDGLARSLQAAGVRPGDRVAYLLAGGEPLASLHLAAQRLGAASVPLSTRLSSADLAYCVNDAQTALLVTDEMTAPVADQAPGLTVPRRDVAELSLAGLSTAQCAGPLPPAPEETAASVMLYTSGTTGRPKGVPRSHRAEHSAAVAHIIQAQLRPGETVLGVMPMFHTMGLRTLLASIVCGGTWVPQARFDAAASVQLIRDENISALYLVPTIFWSLLHSDGFAACRSVQRIAYAGAPMTPVLAGDLAEALQPSVFVNHYGSTEIYTFTISPDAGRRPGCAGRAGVFSRIRLIFPNDDAAPDDLAGPGDTGQVIASMSSPEAFAGYWNRPDANEKAIHDGWYYTGDLAVADEHGDLWVSGRVNDMINSGGENIYPDQIEAALARSAAVADICVVGMPDDRWGSAVTAFVVPPPGVEPGTALPEVARFVTEESGLASLHRPKRLIAVAEIPRSAVGKTLRRRLPAGEYTALAELEIGSPS